MMNDPKFHIFKVSVENMIGFDDFVKFFDTLESAKACFEEIIAKCKTEKTRVKQGDGWGKNFERPAIDEEILPNRLAQCIFKYWYQSSYETDEQEVGEDTIMIEKVPVY